MKKFYLPKLLLYACFLIILLPLNSFGYSVYTWNDGTQQVSIIDQYHGADDHGYGDVIGSEDNFDIELVQIALYDDIKSMAVSIKTNYSGNAGDGVSLDTDFGDFFISTDYWTPYGSSPYLSDNSSNGEDWEYVFDVSENKLYDIQDNQDSILLSQDVMPNSGWIFRNGQEVLIDPTGLDALSETTGSSQIAHYDGYNYNFVIHYGDLDWDLNKMGFHWTMTCGNDVIEGGAEAPVPEPTTMLLLTTGLLGLAGARRKMKK